MRLAARIHVLAGAFADQRLAYAHLLDAAGRTGISPDLDHVEVVTAPHGARLRGYFDDGAAEALTRDAGGDALILVLPGALVTGAFAADDRLRDLGRWDGHVVRAPVSE